MPTTDPDRAALVEAFWLQYRLGKGERGDRLIASEQLWAWQAVDEVMPEG